jgi:CHAT domain-containing protein
MIGGGMSSPDRNHDPLEAWKAAYNETGSGSLEVLARLARMSRALAGYRNRSLDAHLALFGLTGDVGVLFAAIQLAGPLPDAPAINPAELGLPLFAPALERNPEPTRWRGAIVFGFARLALGRGLEIGALERLQEGAAALAEAGELNPELRPGAEHELTTLAIDFYQRGGTEELGVSVAAWRALVRLSPSAGNLNNLAATLMARRDRDGGEVGDLDELIDVLERFAEVSGDRVEALMNIAMARRERFRATATRADIDTALADQREALGLTSGDDRRHVVIAQGEALRERAAWSGEARDYAEAVEFWRGEVAAAPVEQREHVEWLVGLVGTLIDRYDRFGNRADLDAAVDAVDEAKRASANLRVTPRYRQRLLEVEAGALEHRQQALGASADLDRLIETSRRELNAAEPDSPDRTRLANQHAFFLRQKFDRGADQPALNDAIAALEANPPAEDCALDVRLHWLDGLGHAYLARARLWGIRKLDDVVRARERFEEALRLGGAGDATRTSTLLGLADAVHRLVAVMPVLAGDELVPFDLVERAVEEAPDERSRAYAEVHLASALLTRSHRTGAASDDLDRAIEMLERQEAADDGAAARIELLLASALVDRFRNLGKATDARRAAALFRTSLARPLPSSGEPLLLTSAWEWGDWALEREAWDDAAEAFRRATTAAEELYRANVASGASLWLKRTAGLAADAAYAAVRADNPMGAALVLEKSRFRAGSEALALVRAQLQRVDPALVARLQAAAAQWRGVAHLADAPPPANLEPKFTMSFEALRDVAAGLPIPEPKDPDSSIRRPAASDIKRWEATSEDVRSARARFEATVEEIHAAGFDDFLAVPDEGDLRGAAESVSVVYLAAAARSGVAAVLRPEQPPAGVPLEALTASAVDEQVERFRAAYGARAAEPERWSAQLADTTRWLWDAVMAAALELAGDSERLKLVPAGRLGVLPLHAAWCPDEHAPTGRAYAGDGRAISYAPNARSAIGLEAESDGALFAVADPAPLPAGLRQITFAEPEVGAALAWHHDAVVLPKEQATKKAVRDALPGGSVFHFACHGLANLREPRRSALVLSDGQLLTVGELLDLRLTGSLAVLTACETALAGEELPDEVISLPAALVQAGLTRVIATQWAVRGRPAAFLSAQFYSLWKGEHLAPAVALARAQAWVRDSTDGEKVAFADPRARDSPLSVDVRRALWRSLPRGNPNRRSFSDIADWAAYSHWGEP